MKLIKFEKQTDRPIQVRKPIFLSIYKKERTFHNVDLAAQA